MAQKRGSKAAITLYFGLMCLLLLLLGLHAFGIYELNTDFFTRYLIALLFAMLLLPLVPKIKLFDFVDIKREAKMFKAENKKK